MWVVGWSRQVFIFDFLVSVSCDRRGGSRYFNKVFSIVNNKYTLIFYSRTQNSLTDSANSSSNHYPPPSSKKKTFKLFTSKRKLRGRRKFRIFSDHKTFSLENSLEIFFFKTSETSWRDENESWNLIDKRSWGEGKSFLVTQLWENPLIFCVNKILF